MIGKLLDNRYQVIQILATGGFGETYIAKDTRRPGNPMCVVKHLKPNTTDPKLFDTAKRLFQSEAETLEGLGNHDQIPRLLAYFDENHNFYLVQEYIEGHPLSEELLPGRRWNEAQIVQLLQEVLLILEFVHQQGVIHRDIKPDNIIRRASDNKFVLVDFGAVKKLRSPMHPANAQSVATVAIGTPGYMPTEQSQGKPRPNSDIYSLGIIAIQALTGLLPSQLQDDPNTGEHLWQHIVPVSTGLAAVITRMVRYHFKDRYQNATETLRALQEMGVTPAREYAAVGNKLGYDSPTVIGRQPTLALAPSNPNPRQIQKNKESSYKRDPLPILIGIGLCAGAAALMINGADKFRNFDFSFASKDNTAPQYCMAVVGANSNVRSEPSALASSSVVQTIEKDTNFEVTGTRTKLGWVQVKLDSGKDAWAADNVIKNGDEWISCLRDKGLTIRTVDDKNLVASRPTPKQVPKPSLTPLASPSPSPSPGIFNPFEGLNSQKSGKSGKPADDSNPQELANKLLEEARRKYENGDLQGAVDKLRSIPEGVRQTGEVINQWQDDWRKAESLFNDINTALENGQWDKVKDYQKHPEKLPNTQYWRDKIDGLFKQAAENQKREKQPKEKQPENTKPNKTEAVKKQAAENKPDKAVEKSEGGWLDWVPPIPILEQTQPSSPKTNSKEGEAKKTHQQSQEKPKAKENTEQNWFDWLNKQ
jgi:serine/threonine-protein kinase